MITNKKYLLVLFLFSGILTACGFHLRGEQDLSAVLPEVQVQGTDKYGELGRELHRALVAAKVNITDDSAVTLQVSKEGLTKRVLSVDSAGRANQYELNYQISFKLVKKTTDDNQIRLIDLLPLQSVSAKREYLFDANLVLAKADEEVRLKKDMRQAVVLQLIRRLVFTLQAEKNAALKPASAPK
jgi:LPS-assembly lipoprotein